MAPKMYPVNDSNSARDSITKAHGILSWQQTICCETQRRMHMSSYVDVKQDAARMAPRITARSGSESECPERGHGAFHTIMRRKTITFFVVLLALVVPLNARAQPTVTINGSAVPVTLSAPATVSVKVTGAWRQVTDDWVGLYLVGAPNEPRDAWQYLNGLQIPPTRG